MHGETDEFREETGSEEDQEAIAESNLPAPHPPTPGVGTVRIRTWHFYSPEGGGGKI